MPGSGLSAEGPDGPGGGREDRVHPDHRETAAAWDVVARAKYRGEMEDRLALLAAGRDTLLPPERAVLEPLLPGAHVVHLQCSHGLDALGLLNAGAGRVTGIDVSAEMVAQARATVKRLGIERGRAAFHEADAVRPPAGLDGTADLVYTGKGALPWILDLEGWAGAVRRLSRPGGRVYVFEGHPLDLLWDRTRRELVLRPDAGYFRDEAVENPGFPAAAVERAEGPGPRPRMRERGWRPGEVATALARSGLVLERLAEHPDLFWEAFPGWPDRLREALPHAYSILARRPE